MSPHLAANDLGEAEGVRAKDTELVAKKKGRTGRGESSGRRKGEAPG
jgi:hypothetical protein